MVANLVTQYKRIDEKVESVIHLTIYEAMIALGCVFAAIVILIRAFYGTELTDEAFYVSDAVTMMHGNLYYAYNNYSYGTGGVFLMIPFLFMYELIVPNLEGVFLYSRICYLFFYYAVLIFGYRILIKDFKKSSVLLITGFMIVFAGGGNMFNFSYNMTPLTLAYISGLTIYDAVEHENKYSRAKLILAGFLMGIAVLGHLGYGIAIAVFACVILQRTKGGIKEKAINLLYCVIGGVVEMLVVAVPIIAQAGISTLVAGTHDELNPYPQGSMYSGTTADKLDVLKSTYMHWLPYLLVIFIFALVFSFRYIRENEKKLSIKGYVLLSFASGMFFLTMCFCYSQAHSSSGVNWQWGFLGSIGIVAMLILFEFKRYPLVLYMGVYPLIFAFASVVGIDSSASTGRFVVAVPAMAVYFLLVLNEESELARLIATVSVIGCIFSIGVNEFRYVYRDDHFSALDYKVEAGVNKGIYTTDARAHDLPELEEYLNNVIDENDYYAFRDNVPAAYLMVHKGTMCDKDTWDCLNYSYHHGTGSPSTLYEYYKRRGAFPTKVIYVDYGRDENLSIEDPEYMYNEFIDTYYEKIDDVRLNETFYHVVVYEYKGGFDGDFDYWINRHIYKDE